MNPLYKFVNWYTQHLPFPKKGWKYVQPFLRLLHLSGQVYKKKLFNGLFMYVNATDHIQKTVFWYGHYEEEVSHVWQYFVKEDSIVLDIGANIGYFTLFAAAKAKSGNVFSFEPVSSFRNDLQQNIALNDLPNVTVVPFGVNNKKEQAEIYLSAEDNLGMSSLQPPENFSGRKESVGTIVLDEWIKQEDLQRIDLVKIDVEGAEKRVLEGMKTILQTHQPVIFIEVINTQLYRFNSSAKAIYAALSEYGYNGYAVVTKTSLKPIPDGTEGYDLVFLPKNFELPQPLKITNWQATMPA